MIAGGGCRLDQIGSPGALSVSVSGSGSARRCSAALWARAAMVATSVDCNVPPKFCSKPENIELSMGQREPASALDSSFNRFEISSSAKTRSIRVSGRPLDLRLGARTPAARKPIAAAAPTLGQGYCRAQALISPASLSVVRMLVNVSPMAARAALACPSRNSLSVAWGRWVGSGDIAAEVGSLLLSSFCILADCPFARSAFQIA